MFWKKNSSENRLSWELQVVPIDFPELPKPTESAGWVLSVLQTQGSMKLSELSLRVAQNLFQDALRHGAAVVDIGLFGEGLFNAEALAVLESGDGIWWTIGKVALPPALVPVDTGSRSEKFESEIES